MKTSAHRNNTVDPFDPRNLWLAGLGLTAIARREAGNVAVSAGTRAEAMLKQAAALAVDTRDVARGGLMTVREIVEPRLATATARVLAGITPILDGIVNAAQKGAPVSKRVAGKAGAKKTASANTGATRGPRKTAATKRTTRAS